MEEIKRAGPKLRRMLTEEPGEALFGAVDLWCPVLHNYKPEDCQARQKQGEQIWWYVCTGPKTPYPTLFIDHDAITMRIWLWMSWQSRVPGTPVVTRTYWEAYAGFPAPQPRAPGRDARQQARPLGHRRASRPRQPMDEIQGFGVANRVDMPDGVWAIEMID